VSVPAVPTLGPSTAEPPKAAPNVGAPIVPILPQPTEITQPPLPVKTGDPGQPVVPMKPDFALKPANPENTLNPAGSPVAPVGPPVAGGREVPGGPVDRPKPPEIPFEPTDKYRPTLPPPTVAVPHHRDDNMLNITTSAAFAFLGGALLAAEQAKAAPPLPPIFPLPANAVRADADTDKLKDDLKKANEKIAEGNRKIAELKEQVAKLDELLNGRVDDKGFRLEPNTGAVEQIKKLRDKIDELDREVKSLKTQQQTALKPAIGPTPEARPKGVVKVVNEYPVEISIVINERSYPVAAGTKLEVAVPAGEFSYLLLQSGAPATRSVIKDKEVVTLRIK
jgi:hypothetical protein